MVARRGGALLLTDLLRAATTRPVVGQSVDDIAARPPHETLHALIDVVPDGNGFRVARLRGACGPAEGEPPPAPLEQPTPTAKVLVLDDAGNAFRHAPAAWRDLLASRPDWLVLRMARPLATGPLWEQVRHGPISGPGGADPEPHQDADSRSRARRWHDAVAELTVLQAQ